MGEHLHTRAEAGLFDVSHMGQAILHRSGSRDHGPRSGSAGARPTCWNSAAAQQRYTVLLNGEGGIVDDLMVTRPLSEERDGQLLLVVNASRKDVDYRDD
jgi:aminomethyltransferase